MCGISMRGQKLSMGLGALQHLDLSHCISLSDQAAKTLAFYCRTLVSLRIAGCPKYLTTGMSYLRELDASGCVLLSDRSVRLLERCCPPLVNIRLAYCCGISRLAALRLQPRVQHWESSADDPPLWFGYNNMGQMREPIRSPSK
ncbi:hypothetical protein CRUP_021260, partial [Coryphaenoides rupestris]